MAIRDGAYDPDEEFENDKAVQPPAHLAVLNGNQRKFVAAFLQSGNATLAAAEAGYGGKDGKYCSQRGYELMHMEKIRTAITAEQLEHGHGLRSLAIKVWTDILNDPVNTLEIRKLKLAAAREIADRFGLIKKTKTEGEVVHRHQFENMPVSEVEAFIQEKIKATKLIEDATFEELDEAGKAFTIPSVQELKGLPAPVEQDFGLPSQTVQPEVARIIPRSTEDEDPAAVLARMLAIEPEGV